MSLNILMKDGKIYVNGEMAGEFDDTPPDIDFAVIERAVLMKIMAPRYAPCIECGNPARGGHCFKCRQKRAGNADKTVDSVHG